MSAEVLTISGIAVPLGRDNVDTDALAPAAPMKALGLGRHGLGKILFHESRFGPDGRPRPGFVLDDPRYAGAAILVAGDNFGCGSSREHAVWALVDGGFKAVLALGFGDIFEANAYKNGLLPARLAPDLHRGLLADLRGTGRPPTLALDLAGRSVALDGRSLGPFACDELGLRMIREGTDEIGLTAAFGGAVAARTAELQGAQPWLAGWAGPGEGR